MANTNTFITDTTISNYIPQSDWDVTDSTELSYIKNKPSVVERNATIKYDDDYGAKASWCEISEDNSPCEDDGVGIYFPWGESNNKYGHEIYMNDSGNQMYHRGRNGREDGFQNWVRIYDDAYHPFDTANFDTININRKIYSNGGAFFDGIGGGYSRIYFGIGKESDIKHNTAFLQTYNTTTEGSRTLFKSSRLEVQSDRVHFPGPVVLGASVYFSDIRGYSSRIYFGTSPGYVTSNTPNLTTDNNGLDYSGNLTIRQGKLKINSKTSHGGDTTFYSNIYLYTDNIIPKNDIYINTSSAKDFYTSNGFRFHAQGKGYYGGGELTIASNTNFYSNIYFSKYSGNGIYNPCYITLSSTKVGYDGPSFSRDGNYLKSNNLSMITLNNGSVLSYRYLWQNNSSGQIYVQKSIITSSDRRVKENIAYVGNKDDEALRTYIPTDVIVNLVDNLKPVSFTRIEDKENNPILIHHGFIAQDVKATLEDLGLEDQALVTETESDIVEKNGKIYGLNYEELISDLVKYCQVLKQRVDVLEAKINEE